MWEAIAGRLGSMTRRARIIAAVVTGLALVVPVTLVAVEASAETNWVAPVNAPLWEGFHPPTRHHDGIDIGAQRWVPIRAASAGTVIRVRCNAHINGDAYSCDIDGSPTVRGCGWYVDIWHPDGYATRYCHMVVEPLVKVGDQVETGQVIGYVGTSGNSSAPHLHFEVHVVGRGESLASDNAIDPVPFMREHGAPLGQGRDLALPQPPTPPDAPLPHHSAGDLDGDGLTDLVAWRPATGLWYVPGAKESKPILSAPVLTDDGVAAEEPIGTPLELGALGDVPVVGDYDGDGRDDLAVWRPADGRWLVQTSSGQSVSDPVLGTVEDLPVPGDYDGDGLTDVAVFSPFAGTWTIRRADGTLADPVTWGTVGDLPVVADYDADGKDDIAVFRPSDGGWYIITSSGVELPQIKLGLAGDFPVPGDYDGDGLYDYAVWRPSEGAFFVQFAVKTTLEAPVLLGTVGDMPVIGDYDGDGRDDLAVWRPAEARWLILSSSDGTIIDVEHGQRGDIPVNRPLWIDSADGNPITAADQESIHLRVAIEQSIAATPEPSAPPA